MEGEKRREEGRRGSGDMRDWEWGEEGEEGRGEEGGGEEGREGEKGKES